MQAEREMEVIFNYPWYISHILLVACMALQIMKLPLIPPLPCSTWREKEKTQAVLPLSHFLKISFNYSYFSQLLLSIYRGEWRSILVSLHKNKRKIKIKKGDGDNVCITYFTICWNIDENLTFFFNAWYLVFAIVGRLCSWSASAAGLCYKFDFYFYCFLICSFKFAFQIRLCIRSFLISGVRISILKDGGKIWKHLTMRTFECHFIK